VRFRCVTLCSNHSGLLIQESEAGLNHGLSLQNILIDLQSLKLIDFHLLLQSAQRHLFNLLGALASTSETSSQLRLENLALRQQLAVLQRSAPKRLKRKCCNFENADGNGPEMNSVWRCQAGRSNNLSMN
jgi:hypothetical protein